MFLCRLGARRQIHHRLNTSNVAAYLSRLAGEELHRVPHGDTVANYLATLAVEALAALRTDLVRQLLEGRHLEKFRLLDRDYLVALDGTGCLVLGNRPTPFTDGCLTQTLSNGETLYYRPVLEAKLVTRTGLVLSVETEFLENPPRRDDQSAEAYKQDCELKGAYRLLPRLHDAFPRLPICLLLDGLYACEPVFALAERCGWHFIIVLKDGSLPTVGREFQALAPQQPENTCSKSTKTVRQVFRWVNDIDHDGRPLHVLECVETPRDGTEPTTWRWVTNLPITRETAIALANEGGRQRWHIENEGFRVQKHGGYEMEHAYAERPEAARNFYLLLQIGHLMAQLFEAHQGGKKRVAHDCGSLRNLARLLLEAFRTDRLPSPEEVDAFLATAIQVRLDSS